MATKECEMSLSTLWYQAEIYKMPNCCNRVILQECVLFYYNVRSKRAGLPAITQ